MGVKVREKTKGSGIWWVFINHNGKRKAKKVGNESEAKQVAKKIEAKLVLRELNIEKPQTKCPAFKEYSEAWLEITKGLRREATNQRYRTALKKYVYPILWNVPLDEIKRGQIRDLLLKIHNGGLSKTTVCLIRDIVSGPLGYAVDEELIPANPVTGVLKRLNLGREKRMIAETLTKEEVNLFLDTCKKFYPEHHPFFLCAFRTGMRLGELLALQWSDVDFNSKFINVRRSYRIGRIEKTKNGKDRRVDMSDQLSEVLHSLLIKRKEEGLRKGRSEPVEIVFHREGSYMEQNFIRRVFKKILSKAGIREIRIHDMRHTFASLLLTNGESPVYVKEQLGHSSIQMTVDRYGHLIPSANRKAVNGLDDTKPDATYAQPPKMKKAQLVEVTPTIR